MKRAQREHKKWDPPLNLALATQHGAASPYGTTDCNVTSLLAPVATGSRSNCVSDVGAFDMVGNLSEWVADWAPASPPTACPGWGGVVDDDMCLWSADTTPFGPAALLRGGAFGLGPLAGPFMVNGSVEPFTEGFAIGFRCARRL